MSWIDEVDVSEADGKLAEMYAALIEQRGKVSNILKVHSLSPEAMGNHLDLYMTLMFGKSGLSRAEREAIAVVVSANNDCDYCVNHHAEALRRYIKDDLTLIVAYFNFVNRIALGLGVTFDADELTGYRDD